VRVIDGDTIVITDSNTHIRLNGVEAPEVIHPGYAHDDDFGPEAREEMRRIIGAQIVHCELNGERSHERMVGICFLPDGTDIGAEIIRRGLALDCARFSGSKYRKLEPDGVREIIHAAPYCG
jgi:micrococcal nuclease